MIITVTQEHIDKAYCPLTEAIMQHFQPTDEINVTLEHVYFHASTLKGSRKLPPEACKFFRDYYSGHKVKPFTFTL